MSSPLVHDPAAAPSVIQAGRWYFQINTGTLAAPVWAFCYGITELNPKLDKKTEDATDIHDDGYERQAGVGGAYTIDIAGNVRGEYDEEGEFTQDPGQAALLAANEDFDTVTEFRWWRRDGVPISKQGTGIVKVTLDGGKPGTTQKFKGQIIIDGKPADVTKPLATP
jgi:hypothetical protein